jgi:DNA-directed RNA polymerase subunit M/transcription elongation factor TFIIS
MFFRNSCPSCHSLLYFHKEDVLKGLDLVKGIVCCFICKDCGKTFSVKENPFELT